jgi:dihydroorotate dehydrogenase (NAD+) catalytic subunit
MPDLGVRIGRLHLKNPIIAASGTFGFAEEYSQVYDPSKLGAVCTKGLTLNPRAGNPPPRIWETPCGMLNSIGLQNPGLDVFLSDILPRMKEKGITVVANFWGENPDQYQIAAAKLESSAVDAIELNLSCPNTSRQGLLGDDPAATANVVRLARKASHKPLWVKLPPSARLEVALAAQNAGADAISAVNTFRGMAIDINTGAPVFANVVAGLSGPAIKPLALRVVYELSSSLQIPVVGIGGISDWRDVIEFIMAGAWAVQVGTQNFVDPLAGPKIIGKLGQYIQDNKIENWEELRGCAQR